MCPVNDNPASCEIRAVIRFLHTKSMSAVEVHCEVRPVYDQNVTSKGTVRQWCRMFKDGRTNVHDEERSCRPSVVSDDIVLSVDKIISKRRRFTISRVSCEFPQILPPVFYEVFTV
jgi:hypothetical protein